MVWLLLLLKTVFVCWLIHCEETVQFMQFVPDCCLAIEYILCYMELREGDVAENQNIRSSRGAAEYSLTFEIVLPGGRVQFCFSNSPAGRLSPIDKPASADRSGDRTRPP